MFFVVKFPLEGDAVSGVPSSWVETSEGQQLCRWPECPNDNLLRQLRNGTLSINNVRHKTYPCKVLGHASTEEELERKVRAATVTSDIDTDTRSTKKQLFSPRVDSDSEDEESDDLLDISPLRVKKRKSDSCRYESKKSTSTTKKTSSTLSRSALKVIGKLSNYESKYHQLG